MADEMKTCPHCAEEVNAEAVKCRPCGSEMPPLANEERQAAKTNYVSYPVVFLVLILCGVWISFKANDALAVSNANQPVLESVNVDAASHKADNRVSLVSAVEVSHWGDYESWRKWKVFIVPETISRSELVTIAKKIFKKYPNTSSRFFDNAEKIQEYIDAEKFIWDTTGTVARSEFPTEWRKEHLIGIIHDRSEAERGRWQVIFKKGGVSQFLVFLN